MSDPARPPSVWREVVQFAVPGFVALVLLAIASYAIAHRVAEDEALRTATERAEVMARAAVEPYLAEADLGRSVGLSELDKLVQERLVVDPVVAVRLWTSDGTVAYATDPRLIGMAFGLDDEQAEILRRGGADTDLSDLTKAENTYDQQYGELVEVYLPVRAGDGTPYLFEVYTRRTAIDEAAARIMAAFLPVLVGSLVVLTGILIALAWRMARRLQQESAQREELLHRALDSSETERRRIAADLHDGVVQDLAGVTYSLAALSDRTDDPAVADALGRTAGTTRSAVRSLRSLLVDIYPASLAEAGLTAALSDLTSALPPGVTVTLDTPADLALPDDHTAALYRAARESLQNVARHSGATHVAVRVAATPAGGAVLTVADDGRGFDPTRIPSGHLGISLLRSLADTVGGTYEVTSAPGAGTTVRFEVPPS